MTPLEERVLVSAPADSEKGRDFNVEFAVLNQSSRSHPIPVGPWLQDFFFGFRCIDQRPCGEGTRTSARCVRLFHLGVLINSPEDFLNGIEPVPSLEDDKELPDWYPVPRLQPKSESPIADFARKSTAFDPGYGPSLSILASPPDSPSHGPLDSPVYLASFWLSSSLLAVHQSDPSEFETASKLFLHSHTNQSESLEKATTISRLQSSPIFLRVVSRFHRYNTRRNPGVFLPCSAFYPPPMRSTDFQCVGFFYEPRLVFSPCYIHPFRFTFY